MLTPNPIAFSIFGIEIRWYAICILTGIVLALLVGSRTLKKLGIDTDIIYDYLIVCLPLGIIGARLYYVLFEWSYYSNHLSDIYKIWNGGLAIHGGLIGAFIGIYLVSRSKKLNVLFILDIVAPCFLLAQSIGRWGNFFNMEAHGVQTTLPWAINVIDPVLGSIMVHPTFLYESIWDFLGFLLLYFIIDKKFKKYDGELICSYFIYYSIGRFFIEGLRTDSLMIFGLRTAQIVSLALIIIGIVGIIIIRKTHKKENIKYNAEENICLEKRELDNVTDINTEKTHEDMENTEIIKSKDNLGKE
ncbi:prolipoprotein diacylglyceryl transferase [Anaerofustis butyriciformans]|uniref:prolipoprotein diacylglyceryl transferase n=1 Tax=Anaerofustis TaxID=264995 RepID=UPI003F89C993